LVFVLPAWAWLKKARSRDDALLVAFVQEGAL
jgi:hypothetical protein